MNTFDVIIIGAGAAGLMCTAEAGKRGRKVLLLEHSKNIGEKIRISGGGRCNFTNLNVTADNFLSDNSHFCISALKQFSQHDFISLVKKHQIAFHEKTLGQLFCDISSKQIVEMLLSECKQGNVTIQTEAKVSNIQKAENFSLEVNGEIFSCESLVIASGGLSIPKMGASDFGYQIARKFGLNIIAPRAGLVPFTFSPAQLEETKNLAGISLEAKVSCGKRQFREGLLFTHKGLSGPVILQISSYHKEGQEISINLMPDLDIFLWLQEIKANKPRQELQTVLAQILPKKLALFIADKISHQGFIADLSKEKIKQIATLINDWRIIPYGTEGFAKAEVTLGGVDTDEISSKTFECKLVPSLYFIGEVLDVTGHLGGYNFQWAWSSGFVAGQNV